MADRVAIIGGKTPGRDHFPFAVVDRSGSGYPIGLSPTKACKWFWRVRKWSISISASMNISTDVMEYDEVAEDLVVNTYTATATWIGSGEIAMCLDIGGSPLSREAQLVSPCLGLTLSITDLGSQILWSDGLVTAASVDEGAITIFSSFFPDITFQSSSLYPAIGAGFLFGGACRPPNLGPLAGSYGGGSESVSMRVGDDGYVSGGTGLGSSLPIDGEPLSLLYLFNHSPTSEVTTSITLSSPTATISANPSEFWPYANSEGLPVYDTATGAQLRDPLS